MLAGTNQQMDTVKGCRKGKLVVANVGKMIEQTFNLAEIPVGRVLAWVAQGLQVKRIRHEFQSNEQLEMLKFTATIDQQQAPLKEGFEVVWLLMILGTIDNFQIWNVL